MRRYIEYKTRFKIVYYCLYVVLYFLSLTLTTDLETYNHALLLAHYFSG